MVPKQGENPNQPGPQNQLNGTGNIELPKPSNLAKGQTPAGGGQSTRKDDKGSSGDTHLGDFPKAANYERFYKVGEKGPPIDIRDARYVVSGCRRRSVAAGGGGKMVADTSRPAASTPFTNVPLKRSGATSVAGRATASAAALSRFDSLEGQGEAMGAAPQQHSKFHRTSAWPNFARPLRAPRPKSAA